MSQEEAVQMFLSASEPILIDVRRQSYVLNADVQNSNNYNFSDEEFLNEIKQQNQQQHLQQNQQQQQQTKQHQTQKQVQLEQQEQEQQKQSKPKNTKKSSSSATMSVMTTPQTKHYYHHHHHHHNHHHHHPPEQVDQLLTTVTSAVHSLKFPNLVISSNSKFSNTSTQKRINKIETSPTPSATGTHNDKYKRASLLSITSPVRNTLVSPLEKESPTTAMMTTTTTATTTSTIATTTTTTAAAAAAAATTSTMLSSSVDEKPSKESTRLISVGIQTENFTSDFLFGSSILDSAEQIIDNDDNLFGECLAPEIDIEEITLKKSEGNERLGLTVCYSSSGGNGSGSDDTDTGNEVYISDIMPDSIAGRDGRLRQGDQILQVNGKDVFNKEETESLIAENNNAVTLLVSRYLFEDEDEYSEQEEYYEEDDPNMTYTNCFLGNYIVSENVLKSDEVSHSNRQVSFDKKLDQQQNLSVVEENVKLSFKQQELGRPLISPDVSVSYTENIPTITTTTATTTATTATKLITSSIRDPLNHKNIRAHLDQVNQEIAMLDSRVENMMMLQKKNSDSHPQSFLVMQMHQKQQQQQHYHRSQSTALPTETCVLPVMEYDTEHIYETIPEDSESEPFYCSPYQVSEHPNCIEEWLDMQDTTDSNDAQIRSLEHQKLQNHFKGQHQQQIISTKTKNGTLHSTNSSAGDDHESSSCAYNTGLSCNSNTTIPMTLELCAPNPNYRDRDYSQSQSQSTTLILCPTTKHTPSPMNEIHSKLPQTSVQNNPTSNTNYRYSKDKLLSPSHVTSKLIGPTASQQQSLLNKQKIFQFLHKHSADSIKPTQYSQNTPPITTSSTTMYTNVSNLQQTMLMQQHLFRQALINQRVSSNSMMPCPQFTAPNLSQYHFVSSQEVSTVKLNTHPNEEQMVWKVKRRQDGTRYIVRRPARNKLLRNRALRINTERNNDQTTEDDTVSEIKTGRYWTKEERKKHIEKARERKQREQIILTNKNNEIPMLPPSSTVQASLMASSELTTTKRFADKGVACDTVAQQQTHQLPQQQQQKQSRQQKSVQGISVHRNQNQNQNQSSSTTIRKLLKKNTLLSPTVEVNNIHLTTITGSPVAVVGTSTTSTSTAAAVPSTTTNTYCRQAAGSAGINVSGSCSGSGSGCSGNKMLEGYNNNGGSPTSVVSSTACHAYQHTKVIHPPL